MEEQLLPLLAATQSGNAVQQAEEQLRACWSHPDYSPGLVAVASHESVPVPIRQAALAVLKQFIKSCWSTHFDEFQGKTDDDLVPEEVKRRVRASLLDLVISENLDPRVRVIASSTVSRIGSADFPERWPDLLPTLLHIISTGSDGQLHGALRVLADLVEDGFGEGQFFHAVKDLVQAIYNVAVADTKAPTLRALAVSVFRHCLDTLETIMEEHKAAVKEFAEVVLNQWIPFLLQVLQAELPPAPDEQDETARTPKAEMFKGYVTLKLQVVKVLMRIRAIFSSILSPRTPDFFRATWGELSILQTAYVQFYIQDDRQSSSVNLDNLPYTLDLLILEYLDFMQACLRAPPVRSQLEQELHHHQDAKTSWVAEVMKLAVTYAQITTEEEGLWGEDVNVFVSEETSVTANYTPRTACGDLVIKMGEWLTQPTIDALLYYAQSLYSTTQSWKAKEAVLYILNQVLTDLHESDKQINPEAAAGFVDFIRHATEQPEVFLRARGYLVAGSLVRTTGQALQQLATSFLEACLPAITQDESEVVQVSCIRALAFYLQSLPPTATQPLQQTIFTAIDSYLRSQDLEVLADSEDLMATLVETLRDVIFLDPRVESMGPGLDLIFNIAGHCADNLQLASIIDETFKEVTETNAKMGGDAYVNLCAKVLPSLNGALDVGNLTQENNLTILAAELLQILAQHGPEPLPKGFVQATMPKLNRILLEATEEELLRAATMTVKDILSHAHQELFEWRNEEGKGGLEVCLIIIDRLLSTDIDDAAAVEVGVLAAEVVEKAGSERLGPYLPQLLRAVAIRLGSATLTQFIQSLALVFVRLSINNASGVVDFLAGFEIDGVSALQVVMSKWLENSIHFVGYDEIRQNVIALSKIYELKDARLAQVQVKGDLIIPQDGRIRTRSRTKQNPDQYTVIAAPLKILKVLIAELSGASGSRPEMDAAAAAADLDEESDDGEWEDEPNAFLELGGGLTKEQLMAYAAEDEPGSGRQWDNETQAFLLDFFNRAAQSPGFKDEWDALTTEEQARLQESAR